MQITLNTVDIANHSILRSGIEDTIDLINKSLAANCEEKRCGVNFPGH
jgi:hypothetical protein